MQSDKRLFHGGCRGLEPGDTLQPASVTGVQSVSGSGGAPYNRERVYLAATAEEARSYAALHIPPAALEALEKGEQIAVHDLGGDLYEVETVGELVSDRDYAESASEQSWEAPAARVVRVLERNVPPDLSVLEESD